MEQTYMIQRLIVGIFAGLSAAPRKKERPAEHLTILL